MTKFIEVVTTHETADQAREMAKRVIEQRLGACCQIQPIESIYRWKNVVEIEPEFQLTIKTTEFKYKQLESLILKSHSYETPQIICLQILKGSDGYLAWMDKQLK